MLTALIDNKVYFKVFDKTFKASSHIYSIKNEVTSIEFQNKMTEIDCNLKQIKLAIKCNKLLLLNQIHGDIVIDADQINEFDYTRYTGDASVTTKTGIALTVLTADCVPLLLSCQQGNIIGAAHCGWKGIYSGVIENLVNIFRIKGVQNIKAVIGPAIQQSSYEVDQQFYERLINKRKDYRIFFAASKILNKYIFDLPQFVKQKLEELDISDILVINDDTYALPEKYPSHRRKMHQGIINTQHILSTILIK
ncbi:MAG: peptidoglycan editing factor PgeF [Rickettsiaceae bacterium]|nr:MAG: peptidoglycan editing factor PgeF [Rickettsiaceae bacterium]